MIALNMGGRAQNRPHACSSMGSVEGNVYVSLATLWPTPPDPFSSYARDQELSSISRSRATKQKNPSYPTHLFPFLASSSSPRKSRDQPCKNYGESLSGFGLHNMGVASRRHPSIEIGSSISPKISATNGRALSRCLWACLRPRMGRRGGHRLISRPSHFFRPKGGNVMLMPPNQRRFFAEDGSSTWDNSASWAPYGLGTPACSGSHLRVFVYRIRSSSSARTPALGNGSGPGFDGVDISSDTSSVGGSILRFWRKRK